MSRARDFADLAGTSSTDLINQGRNLIINGACAIDQRNGGAAITGSGYVVDRFHYQNDSDATLSLQQNSTVPDNFANSISVTVSTADASVGAAQYSMMTQRIEGYNIANLGWGTSAAKAVTLSFYVRSSVTGTFGGVLNNSDSSRSYPFTYSISSADTWEKKTITVEGDTSGTWNNTNSSGIQLRWAFGMGSTYTGTAGSWSGNLYFGASGAVDLISTLNATWYITGVQLEVGETATPFEHEDYGTTLRKCQRYYEKSYNQSVTPGTATNPGLVIVYNGGGFGAMGGFRFAVTKRATPTMTGYNESGTSGQWGYPGGSGAVTLGDTNETGVRYIQVSGTTGPANGHFVADAEL